MLGYGIVSYFNVLIQLMWMFAFISIVLVIPTIVYSQFSALEEYPSYETNRYTLGNIGGA